ncbi:hypothetical protein LOTGIDRAFT_234067 [Lottia gigantea]|uniref:DH domain-containing protein n=1 Tax=Lottia gigantea TaxID=225164 RepID=V4A9J6_LOTGI|nr:hypothetical protein LOTGIDRAFT_234067 [Lottia gigantea]ESO89956.1 hypothetical protein LOTGIDRAFT_234067 [Lottia gigantea]
MAGNLVGTIRIPVQYKYQTLDQFEFYVTRSGTSLMGLDLFNRLGFELSHYGEKIQTVASDILQKYPTVFSDSPEEKNKSLPRFKVLADELPPGAPGAPEYHILEEDEYSLEQPSRLSQPCEGTVSKLMAAFQKGIKDKSTLDKNQNPTSKDTKKINNHDTLDNIPSTAQHIDDRLLSGSFDTVAGNSMDIDSSHLYKHIDKIYDTPPSTPVLSCKQGYGAPVSVKLLDPPVLKAKAGKGDGSYDHIVFDKLNIHESFENSGTTTAGDTNPLELSTKSKTGSRKRRRRQQADKKSSTVGDPIDLDKNMADPSFLHDDSKIYDELVLNSEDGDDYENDGWGSSEFEEYSDEEESTDTIHPHKPLPMKPKPRHEPGAPGIISRIRSFRGKKDSIEEEEGRCFPVDIDPNKHPPPELPPLPDGLSENQKKRRCVIEQIISSEKSYISSLERIIRGYESVVLDLLGGVKSNTRTVFKESREILSHHQMFQIEMADRVKKWDEDEKIGDIFTASFSKSMLVDAYSVYVNNFAVAMEEIKLLQRSRQSFREFLKLKESSSPDRLSIFGLMVKPVQRFPQFIMFLQDLVKYTPQDHHDRRSLQLALTELENVTHKLNERKRTSEQTFQAKQITNQLLRQITKQVPPRYLPDKTRRLIRQNDFEQVVGESGGEMRVKTRRLILFDDTLLCIKVGIKDVDGFLTEKFKLKWVINLSDVDLKDSAITPNMEASVAAHPERPEEDPFHLYSDLSEILHDCTVLGQMSGLMASLKRSYQGYGLSEDLLLEIVRDLQKMIHIKDEQLRLVNSCSFILADKSSVNKMKYVFQTPSPNLKQEWCVDFIMAKLALDKCNNPGWEIGQHSEEKSLVPAYFMRSLSVDVPRNFTKVKCAVPVFVPSSSSTDLGVQHLWVCSSKSDRGQVSVISIHNPKPCLTESFKASDVEIECMVSVPGLGSGSLSTTTSFIEDTVWIATVKPELVIFSLIPDDGMRRSPITTIPLPHQPSLIICIEEKVYLGLKSGVLLVYSCDDDGVWDFKSPTQIEFGSTPIRCLLDIDGCLWVACGCFVHLLDIDTLNVTQKHELSGEKDIHIDDIVRAGVGIWVSFKNRPYIKLFHIETLELLQEINIASPITRIIDKQKVTSVPEDYVRYCYVSCLAAGRGMLWIGTSLGFILTLPLPRLREGVPLVNSRPSVSYHGHNHPVKFIIPIYCSSSVTQLEKRSSFRSSIRPKMRKNLKKAQTLLEEPETVPESCVDDKNEASLSQSKIDLTRRLSDSRSQITESKHKTLPARSQRLSFRTELATKIASQETSNSDPDLFSAEREVQMLYETLLENENSEVNGPQFKRLSSESPSSIGEDQETVNTSANTGSDVKPRRKLTQEIQNEKLKTVTISGKSLRKTTTNSVIVVSGGDGYTRWNSSKTTSIKNEEAVLLLWIYKF